MNVFRVEIKRVLIDIGCSCEIIFMSVFKQMEIYIREHDIETGSLTGFNGIETLVTETIALRTIFIEANKVDFES